MTRGAADRVMRMLLLSTIVGVVVVVVAAILVSEHRGLLLVIGAVYLVTSLAAQFTVRRSLNREVARQEQRQVEQG